MYERWLRPATQVSDLLSADAAGRAAAVAVKQTGEGFEAKGAAVEPVRSGRELLGLLSRARAGPIHKAIVEQDGQQRECGPKN